jgi:hypothetical protein
MSVDFGKVKGSWPGFKTGLTRQISKQGFRIDSSLDTARLREIIQVTCEEFPHRNLTWGSRKYVVAGDGDWCMMVINSAIAKNAISFGQRYTGKEGGQRMRLVRWGLVLTDVGGSRTLKLSNAKLISGSIDAAEILQEFLNTLEASVQREDPSASITMADG